VKVARDCRRSQLAALQSASLARSLGALLHLLYDAEVLAEEVLLRWAASLHDQPALQTQVRAAPDPTLPRFQPPPRWRSSSSGSRRPTRSRTRTPSELTLTLAGQCYSRTIKVHLFGGLLDTHIRSHHTSMTSVEHGTYLSNMVCIIVYSIPLYNCYHCRYLDSVDHLLPLYTYT